MAVKGTRDQAGAGKATRTARQESVKFPEALPQNLQELLQEILENQKGNRECVDALRGEVAALKKAELADHKKIQALCNKLKKNQDEQGKIITSQTEMLAEIKTLLQNQANIQAQQVRHDEAIKGAEEFESEQKEQWRWLRDRYFIVSMAIYAAAASAIGVMAWHILTGGN